MGSSVGGHQAVFASPAEAILRPAARTILGADPAAITQPVHGLKDGGIIDFTLIRLMPRRHRRTLQMSDHGVEFFETADQIAANDLNVIKIELHADVRPAGLCDHIGRMLVMIEKIVWAIAAVDRLDEQCNASRGGEIRRPSKILYEYPVSGRTLFGLNPAGQAMDRARVDCGCVVE